MKKSLFALAAVGAFAGAAQAQSSVTVYGLLDYGYQGASQRQAGPAAGGTSTNATNIVTKTQTSGFMGNGESTSRLGFRGTEDLGGGLNAFFTVEAAIVTDPNGNVTGSGVFANGGTGNRQTFIGLSKKGLGAASIGVQYTPLHEEAAATSAGALNNQAGDVLYDRPGVGISSYTASGMALNSSYTVRSSNTLILKTERMSGFQVKGMLVSQGRDATQTAAAGGGGIGPSSTASGTGGGSLSNLGYGLNVNWQMQKAYITASYQSFRNTTTNGTTASAASNTNPGLAAGTTAFAVGYQGGAVTAGTNALDVQQYYAASYDFGVAKLFAGYINRKATATYDDNLYIQRSAQQIGVRAPVTKTISSWASVGNGSISNNGTSSNKVEFVGWQLGSDYMLSKRTNLYAIYGIQNSASTATGAYASATGPTANTAKTSWNQSSYAVGMRHTF